MQLSLTSLAILAIGSLASPLANTVATVVDEPGPTEPYQVLETRGKFDPLCPTGFIYSRKNL